MKKLLTALLAAALLLCLPVAAFAADAEPLTDTDPPGTEQLTTDPPDTDADIDNGTEPPEAGPAPIYTAAELQAAVTAASDGDTLAVSSTILLDGVTLATDKGLTLTTASDFCNSNLVELNNGAMISGFSFACDGERTTGIYIRDSSTAATVRNCSFSCPIAVYVAGNAEGEPTAAYIEGCTFANAESSAVCVRECASVTIESCTFTHNTATMQGGAVNNGGVLSISNSTITDNRAASGGGIFNSGTLTLANTVICSNTSTNADFGADIFTLGTLALTDEPTEGKGFYEETTGEKIALPLPACSDTAKLVFLTDEEAAQRFAPPATDPPQESDSNTLVPLDSEQDKPTTETTPPDTTQQPTTPPPTTTTYTPPISHTTNTTNPKRQETTQREETAHNTETATKEKTPPLVCGKAVIDMSRSVVLYGYDDGLLHLEDSLTRGQMATIIYRLLDEDTLALYNTTDSVFSDVPNGLWCCGYISTIAKAGIVAGTGNGCFAPSGKLTWAQIITVMTRFVEPASCTLQNITYNGWAVEAVQTAVALGWIEDSATFNPNAIISRGEFMDFVNGVLGLYHAV